MHALFASYAFIWGALWGSFLNVVVHRLPRNMSLVKPRSHCPSCETQLRWFENVPLFSFAVQLGRCRTCKVKISPRYIFVEGLTAALSLALFLACAADGRLTLDSGGVVLTFLFYFAFICAAIAVALIDLETALIPDILTLPTALLGVVAAIVLPKTGLWVSFFPLVTWQESLIGLFGGAGLILLIAVSYKAATGRIGMGGGDVTMLAMVGGFLGWRALLFVLFFASIQGIVAAISLALTERLVGRQSAVLLRGADKPEFWEARLAVQGAPGSDTEERAGDTANAGEVDRAGEVEGPSEGGDPAASQSDACPADAGTAGAGTAQSIEEDEVSFGLTGIPFGPFLALAAVEYLFVGDTVMRWFVMGV